MANFDTRLDASGTRADSAGDAQCAHLNLFHHDFRDIVREHCPRCGGDGRRMEPTAACVAEKMRFFER
jgi:hypothetical protein